MKQNLFVGFTLTLVASIMLWFSSILPFGDEQWFINIAKNPLDIHQRLWYYGPLMPVLASPFVGVARYFSIAVSVGTFLLVYLIARHRNKLTAPLYILPIAISARLLAGTMWFYWDTFMMFFFVLTLYLIEVKAPKWTYFLTAIMLVNSKMIIGAGFLIPLLFKDRKLAWTWLSYIPMLVAVVLMRNDVAPNVTNLYWPDLWKNVSAWLAIAKFDIAGWLILTAGCLPLIKKHPTYITFYITTIMYSVFAGLGVSHMSTTVYSGALVFPLIADWVLERFPSVKSAVLEIR